MIEKKLIIILQKFIQSLEEKKRSKYTITAYKKDIQQFITFIKNYKKNLETQECILDFLQYVKNLSYSNKTISRKLNAIRTFYKYLKEKNIVKNNIAQQIRHPKTLPQKVKHLSRQECNILRLNIEKNIKLKTIIELILQTGLLISEVCELKVCNIDFDNDCIKINNKNIYLNDKIKSLLYLFISKNNLKTTDYLFQTKNKTPIKIRNLRTQITKVMAKSKLDQYTVNDLRNTFIIFQINNGVSLEFLRVTLGFKTTKSIYRYLKYSTNRSKKQNKNIITEV